MCKFPLTGYLQIICKNFFEKLLQSVSLCHRLTKKLNFIKIWQLKVGLKSQKISTASDQYFLSYVKKTTGGVSNCPPPSRSRVNAINGCAVNNFFNCLWLAPLTVVEIFPLRALIKFKTLTNSNLKKMLNVINERTCHF